MTTVHCLVCSRCGNVIFSRARHDFHWCSCKNIFVDGGFDYMRAGGGEARFTTKDLEIPQTKEELYNDWNSGTDKYGRIPAEEKCNTEPPSPEMT